MSDCLHRTCVPRNGRWECEACGLHFEQFKKNEAAKKANEEAISAATSAIVDAADKWRNDPRAGIAQLTAAVDAWRKLKGM